VRWGSSTALLVIAAALPGCQSAQPEPSPSQDPAPSAEASPTASASTAGVIDPAVIHGVPADVASRVLEVALAHERTAEAHAGEAFEVTDVSVVDGSTFGGQGDYIRVVIEFDVALDPSAWPDEAVCAIGRASDDITGIAWLLSAESETVEAYSPQWDGETTCVP
jgi:hypothetical protein